MSGRNLEHSPIDEEQEEEGERSSYYGGATVPFIWETRPGTPKHYLSSDSSFPPPLTPPPSYYSSTSGVLATPRKQSKVRTKLSKIISMSLFHDLRRSCNSSKKTTNNNVYGSSFSWSSTSSSSSFASSPVYALKKPVSRDKKSSVLVADYKEDELRSSPTSTLCYSNGGRNGFSSSMESMKRALFSIPRNGSIGKSLIVNDMNKA